MNTDRELLQLAAKAVGIDRGYLLPGSDDPDYLPWDPLNDDGDALRLAVKLGLQRNLVLEVGVGGADCEFQRCESASYAHERHDGGGGPYAATRRAIVRAAAAIGETMADEIGRST